MGNIHMMQSTPTPIATPTTAEKPDNAKVNLLANEKPTEEYDIFRDSLLRYLGYTNEIGEASRRHISSRMVFASYAIATAYCCADTIHKAHRSLSRGDGAKKAFINAGDAFVWQILASVIIPGYVINRITYLTRRLVRMKRKKCICKASPYVRYAPLAVGILAIPFIVHPIDNGVTWIMDRTMRLLYRDRKSDAARDPKSEK